MAFHEHFEIDPKTGFLTPKPTSKIKNGFTAQQKVEWLEVYKKTFNFSKASSIVGIGNNAVRDHINGDDKFKLAYKEAKDYVADACQEALYAFIHKNPTSAFGILKALRPQMWKDNYKAPEPNKAERLKGIIDAMKEESKNEDK